jgi:hypothetical protein
MSSTAVKEGVIKKVRGMIDLAHHSALGSIGRQCKKAVQCLMGHMHKKVGIKETATRKKKQQYVVPSGAATTQMKRMFRSNA